MAKIDVSSLLLDPDFTDQATLIQRSITVDGNGEGQITESQSTITVVVQGGNTEAIEFAPEGARLTDLITVWYRGRLTSERPNGYADVIVWNGKRYQVVEVPEDFLNFGAGFTVALCQLEPANA